MNPGEISVRNNRVIFVAMFFVLVGVTDACPPTRQLDRLSGLTHRESYFDMVMTVIVSVIIALVAVLVLGSVFGSF
jgi:hypothetical protein